MAKKLLSHYDTYRNYDEDEYDLEDDEEDDGGMNTFEAHYSFDGQGLDYDDQDDEEEDEEVMLGFWGLTNVARRKYTTLTVAANLAFVEMISTYCTIDICERPQVARAIFRTQQYAPF